MVRILKVKELEERKQLLVAQSQLYRETMRLEAANMKFSFALWKRRFGLVKTAAGLLGMAAPVAGLVMALRGFRRHEAPETASGGGGRGLIAKLMSGVRLATKLRPVWRLFMESRRAARQAHNGQQETAEFR